MVVCLVRHACQTGYWLSPTLVLVYCTATAMTLAIRIVLTVMSGVLAKARPRDHVSPQLLHPVSNRLFVPANEFRLPYLSPLSPISDLSVYYNQSMLWSRMYVIWAKNDYKRLKCVQKTNNTTLHTGPKRYIDRSLYVAVMRIDQSLTLMNNSRSE